MKTVFKHVITAILAVGLMMQTGCWSQKQFEDIGFILQMGLESAPDNKLLLSITSPVIEQEVKEKVLFKYITTRRLIRTSREDMRNTAGKMLQGGKIQHLYFSKELAQKGISEFMEVFLRDPENPLLANIVIVDGSPRELMEASSKYTDKPRPAIYFANLIQDAHRRSAAPEARISNFIIWYYSKTIDPVATFVKFDDENITIAGTAFFKGDKMVGTIDENQTVLLNALKGAGRNFEYTYREAIKGEKEGVIKQGAAFSVNHFKSRSKIDLSGSRPVIEVRLDLKTELNENAGPHNLDKPDEQRKMEDALEVGIREDVTTLLTKLRDAGSDPVGFGELVRSKHPEYWKQNNWKEVYKDAEFLVEVQVTLESYGTIK